MSDGHGIPGRGWRGRLQSLTNLAPGEPELVVAGASMFFFLFTGYFMLRPVRETMGIAGGVGTLQWLFTATFVATLVALPLFGWVASRVPRRRILPWTFAFLIANLLAFALAITRSPDDPWIARSFYVWLSVFNLIAISLAWSLLADLVPVSEAKRLFALIAAGASLGGLAGPIAGTLLVAHVGHGGLMALASACLALSAVCSYLVQRWRDDHPLPEDVETAGTSRSRPLGGNALAGAREVLRSPFLLLISVFVVLLSVVSTFLYFEQARLVAETFPDRTRQTQVFGIIDTVVQSATMFIQVFLTGHIARRFGIGALLSAVPLIMAGGFMWLAVAPAFAVLAPIMVVRRVGEYALVRPGREMLYTVLPVEEKYKAKNFIDTAVYRGGDAIGGWVKTALDGIGNNPVLAMLIGAVATLAWAAIGIALGRRQRRLEQQLSRLPIRTASKA